MILVGAGSAGKETSGFISNISDDQIIFFDEKKETANTLWNKYRIVNTWEELKDIIISDPRFCITIGNPRYRRKMYEKLISLGGVPTNIYPEYYNSLSKLDENASIIQPGVTISYDVEIGKSCMTHANSVIGHKVRIGDFVNISPLCSIIGPCAIGSESYIGASSIILPGLTIGKSVYITAGSIVNRDIKDFETFSNEG